MNNILLNKALRVAKGTSLALGVMTMLALTLALTAGAAEAAKAKSLQAGVQNTVSALTSMVGNLTGPVLKLDNNSTASGATALDLQVEAGKAPLTVSKDSGKATNLDADKVDGKDSTEFAPKTVEAWHEVGSPGEPEFFRGGLSPGPDWANFDDVHNTVGFYKDPYGVVHLKGVSRWAKPHIAPGGCGGVPVFVLPEGYRPAAQESHPSVKNDILTRINIDSAGTVRICDQRTTSKDDWYLLDGISFRAAN